MNWFLPFILSTSISIRSPNVEPNPLDYQLAFCYEKLGILYASVEKEQELGQLYQNEEYWAKTDYKYTYIKNRYVNKSSRGICYNQAEIGLKYKRFYGGYALRHVQEIPSHRFTAGYEKDIALSGVARLVSRYNINTDFQQIDYSTFYKIELGLMKFLSVNIMGQYEKSGENSFWQLKTGVSVEIPTLKGE